MSAIAKFILLPTESLKQFRGCSHLELWDYIDEFGTVIVDFNWSGFVFNYLLVYLEEERKIDLLQSSDLACYSCFAEARGLADIILDNDIKQKYYSLLEPAKFRKNELAEYVLKQEDMDKSDAGNAMMDGVCAIYKSLGKVNEETIVLLHIG